MINIIFKWNHNILIIYYSNNILKILIRYSALTLHLYFIKIYDVVKAIRFKTSDYNKVSVAYILLYHFIKYSSIRHCNVYTYLRWHRLIFAHCTEWFITARRFVTLLTRMIDFRRWNGRHDYTGRRTRADNHSCQIHYGIKTPTKPIRVTDSSSLLEEVMQSVGEDFSKSLW